MSYGVNINRDLLRKFVLHILLLGTCMAFPQIGYSATKQLYLESIALAPQLTRVQQSADTKSAKLGSGDSATLDQLLIFQDNFTISAGVIDIELTVERDKKGTSDRKIKVELFKVSGGTPTSIGSITDTFNIATTEPSGSGIVLHSFQINTSGESFVATDFIRLVITHESIGVDVGETVRIHTYYSNISSQIIMQTNTVINVDTVTTHPVAYPDLTEYRSYQAGDTVFLRAAVSDPFGFADISSVDFTVNDPNSPPSVFSANIITPEPGSESGATAVFETSYSIPAAPDGSWSVDVVANEGTEGVTASASRVFGVGSTDINVKKTNKTTSDPVNASFPKAIPNSHTEYTVEVMNSGFGFADNNSVFITDPLPDTQTTFYFGATAAPYNPVQFSDGAVVSGLTYTYISLASQTDDVQFYSDAACSVDVLSPAVDASGYDISSPKIICVAVNPKGDFNGSDGSNDPSFTIKFIVRVD